MSVYEVEITGNNTYRITTNTKEEAEDHALFLLTVEPDKRDFKFKTKIKFKTKKVKK